MLHHFSQIIDPFEAISVANCGDFLSNQQFLSIICQNLQVATFWLNSAMVS